MVVDRMARRRERTDQVLAFYSPGPDHTRELVKLAKHRWIIERDYQELKQELGLGHYEGRGWRGFHHHATYASPPTASSSRKEVVFPPPQAPVDWTYAPRKFRPSSIPAARRVRVERHNPHSIATLRIQIARYLTGNFPAAHFVTEGACDYL